MLSVSPLNSYGKMYSNLLETLEKHNNITYEQFDKLVINDISLFNVPNGAYLSQTEEILDKIIKAIPAFRRIFARPIIHLKDTHEIVPVEAVKMTDSRSLSYAAMRSELFEGKNGNKIKPRKLMTVEYVETYELYENVVFAYTVNAILRFTKQTLMLFKDILYGCKDIHFNMLDRTHHSSYFMAIAKLHLEYVRAQEDHQSSCERCIDKLFFIERTLRAKLSSPVYTACKKASKKGRIELKRTNIFRSHKDYKQVYDILKMLVSDPLKDDGNDVFANPIDTEYKAFCTCITIFSAAHFNYTFPKESLLSFGSMHVTAHFKHWSLSISERSTAESDVLLLSVKKDTEYSFCIILRDSTSLTSQDIKNIEQTFPCNEYLFASPCRYGEKNVLYLSVFNVDSFRRIQQLILRGMLYSDAEHTVCPFCGCALEVSDNGKFECRVCSAEFKTECCPETNESYFTS